MKAESRNDRAWLVATAKEVARKLELRCADTAIRLRPKVSSDSTDTGGWLVAIGSLGKGKPTLEIWYDKFAGYEDRKLSACFRSKDPDKIRHLVKSVADRLPPVKIVTDADTLKGKYTAMKTRLEKSHFNVPVQEHYNRSKNHYFTVFDPTRKTSARISPYFCERAVDFFEDVARSLPKAKEANPQDEVYRGENRKWVKAHLRRERSGFLATLRKSKDDYRCKVCDMTFTETYGKELGAAFAEAHHIKALGSQKDRVKTKVEDLITVCSNCHRMLHRMEGKEGDVGVLKALFKKHLKAKS